MAFSVGDLQRKLGLGAQNAAFVRARLARPGGSRDDSDDEEEGGDGVVAPSKSDAAEAHALDVAVSDAVAHVLDDGSAGTNRCMMLCYSSGRPKHRRYFYVRKTGIVVWARSAKTDHSSAGFHRGRIVGVLPSAPTVAEKHRARSFVVSTEEEDRQLIIIANSTHERDLCVGTAFLDCEHDCECPFAKAGDCAECACRGGWDECDRMRQV
jgi:hypothetical protein